MLVGERGEEAAAVIVVVEDDSLLGQGIAAVTRLRRDGCDAELLATGSPRKRFDKAVKAGANAILALALREGVAQARFRVDDEANAATRARLSALADALNAPA